MLWMLHLGYLSIHHSKVTALHIFCIPIMSSIDDDDQKLVNKAVALLLKAPMLTIPQTMRAVKFTIAQSEDRALQMRVRRAFDGASKKNSNGKHVGSEVNLTSPMPSMSTVTTSSSSIMSSASQSAGEFVPIPEQKELRLTSVAKVKSVNNKKELGAHARAALKRATLLYAAELKKTEEQSPKKSAEKIAEKVKKQFDAEDKEEAASSNESRSRGKGNHAKAQ